MQRSPDMQTFLTQLLNEDIGRGDITSLSVIPEDAVAHYAFKAREPMVVSGMNLALMLLAMMDERIAADIIRLRSGPDGADGTEDDIPFRNVGELVNANVPPQAVQQLQALCDVRSRTFEVHIVAQIGGYTRRYIAVVGRRDPRNIETLSFRSK